MIRDSVRALFRLSISLRSPRLPTGSPWADNWVPRPGRSSLATRRLLMTSRASSVRRGAPRDPERARDGGRPPSVLLGWVAAGRGTPCWASRASICCWAYRWPSMSCSRAVAISSGVMRPAEGSALPDFSAILLLLFGGIVIRNEFLFFRKQSFP